MPRDLRTEPVVDFRAKLRQTVADIRRSGVNPDEEAMALCQALGCLVHLCQDGIGGPVANRLWADIISGAALAFARDLARNPRLVRAPIPTGRFDSERTESAVNALQCLFAVHLDEPEVDPETAPKAMAEAIIDHLAESGVPWLDTTLLVQIAGSSRRSDEAIEDEEDGEAVFAAFH